MKKKYQDRYGRIYEIHDSFEIVYPPNTLWGWGKQTHTITFDDSDLEKKVQKNREER